MSFHLTINGKRTDTGLPCMMVTSRKTLEQTLERIKSYLLETAENEQLTSIFIEPK